MVKKAKKSTEDSLAWEDAYRTRFGGSKFGSDAIGLFALGLQFNLEDLEAIGAESITGGGNDKKCDLFYIDKEEGRCVIAQCYLALSKKPAAPANKASDLNTAITWLLSTPINSVPEELRPNAADVRQAIRDDELQELCIWYVHNCPESKNVANEITAVEHTANAAIHKLRSNSPIRILAREFGAKHFDRLYRASGSPILVNSDIKTTVPTGYAINGEDWKAYQTFVPGSFIYELFDKHGADLFSANVRDYLGSRETDVNINSGIKETATNSPENFWVYNNGVTALVNRLSVRKLASEKLQLKMQGISIVNGAQTTGAIGSLAKAPKKQLMVPSRFIWTTNKARVQDIIRYNNSQNKISASDFRSTDGIQKRLKEEFQKIPDAEYEGGRRGGTSDTIKRRPNLLPSYTVGQALAAFHGDPVIAYNRKSEIWVTDSIYSSYFKEETTARHIVFAFALYKTIGNKKLEIVTKQKNGQDLTKTEREQLAFFERKGSILLTCAAFADCLEAVLDRPIPNKFRLSFGEKTSPQKADAHWTDLCPPLFSLLTTLNTAFVANRIATDQAKKAIPQFRNVVQAIAGPNKQIFETFASKVKVD
ncbi:AIPR family protein [Bradyrhizobium valentinum]|uniref:Abortive phage infection protein C-terminal domain-containing protein n=1 Tax=Bradyrhizobium valentinum TaxID=1518501 RepID=A0A0R3LL50_9BRAD|nr:AIPR family protein [Bradyrhizobium valentinum]KRR08452.1 hypothetical protein CP49_31410 [Bradyrhizobium valentinum]